MTQVITITRERLPYHPHLGRHINFDSRSKAYAVQPTLTPVTSVRHLTYVGVLDQGSVGGCTGFASTACAYREPFFTADSEPWRYTPDTTGALGWYHENTEQDDYPGVYSPDDTGSDGLTSSKVAMEVGVCSGYQPALDLDSSLLALMDRPGITGIPWYSSMFNPGADGLLTVRSFSGLAGGHELCTDEIVAPDAPGNGTGELLVGGPNSWGATWGARGRWYLRASDWWELRKQQGDVYFWTPAVRPAPQPTPDSFDGRDVDLWAIAEDWTTEPHVGPNRRVATAVRAWAHLKGLTS